MLHRWGKGGRLELRRRRDGSKDPVGMYEEGVFSRLDGGARLPRRRARMLPLRREGLGSRLVQDGNGVLCEGGEGGDAEVPTGVERRGVPGVVEGRSGEGTAARCRARCAGR